MTAVDVLYRYGIPPRENELRAINGAREVYGIRKITFDEAERTVRVEYDATRLEEPEVANLLRLAGLDLKGRVQLVWEAEISTTARQFFPAPTIIYSPKLSVFNKTCLVGVLHLWEADEVAQHKGELEIDFGQRFYSSALLHFAVTRHDLSWFVSRRESAVYS
jgi:hypothetical protein